MNKTLLILFGVFVLANAIDTPFDNLDTTTRKAIFSPGQEALAASPGLRPCSCGPHSNCQWSSNTKLCSCNTGYIGDPPRCRPGPELWDLCFKDDPCGLYGECLVVNGTRDCPSCVLPYEGTPPNCTISRECRQEIKCGPHSKCNHNYYSPCSCIQGFVGEPPNCTAGPALLAKCNPYPCGGYSNCRIQDGAPKCRCRDGFEGTPPNCAPGPEMWRICFKNDPCGSHSKCKVVDKGAVCSPCDKGFIGQPPFCYEEPKVE